MRFSSFLKKLLVLVSFCGAVGAVPAFAQKPGKRIVTLNLTDEPKHLDPQRCEETIGFMLVSHTFEGLFRLDPKDKPIPMIAEKWEVKSPTQYIFIYK